MAKITSVKTSADNNKLFTAQVNDDNTREFKEYNISSGINNKTLQETADVTSFDEGMDVITINPTGDKFVGVNRRGREVVNMGTSNNFSVNSFNLLSSFKVDRLVRGDINIMQDAGYDTTFSPNISSSPTSLIDSPTTLKKIGQNYYVVGAINSVNGDTTYNRFLKFDLDWNIDNSIQSNATFETNKVSTTMIDENNNAFVGLREHNPTLIKINPTGQMDSSFHQITTIRGRYNNFIGIINDIEVFNNGDIAIVGSFRSIDGNQSNHFALLNPDGTFKKMVPLFGWLDLSYSIEKVSETEVLVGTYNIGDITKINVYTDQIDPNFIRNNQFGRYVNDIKIINNKIYVVGNFTVDGYKNIVRLNLDGSTDYTFTQQTTPGYEVTKIHTLSNGDILFTYKSSTTAKAILIDNTGDLKWEEINLLSLVDSDVIKEGDNYIYLRNYTYDMVRLIPGGESFVTQTEIPFVTLSSDTTRLIQVTTSVVTPNDDFTKITISDGTNSIDILPTQMNQEININTLVGRNLTVTYDLTGNKDINTILNEYSIGINK